MQYQDFNHFFEMPVRWSDLDALGHVNNVQYMRYLESGRVAYCADVLNMKFGHGLKAGWILADLQCTFYRQLFYPATIEVATKIHKLGRSSAHLNAAIFDKTDGQAMLSSKGVFVWFDFEIQKSAAIPEVIRQAVADFEK